MTPPPPHPVGRDAAARGDADSGGDLHIADNAVPGGIVRTLTLDRPGRRNALDTSLIRHLDAAFTEADQDQEVRAIVLAASGTAFCAGGDIKEFSGRSDAHELMIRRAGELAALLGLLPQLSVPVLSVVTGPAVGAGAALALSADLVIASDGFSMSFPEFSDGVVPSVVMPSLVHLAGRKLAFEVLTQGRRLSGPEAAAAGLVNRVTTRDRLASDVSAVCTRWSNPSRLVVAQTKALFGRVLDLPLTDALDAGLDVTRRTWQPPNQALR